MSYSKLITKPDYSTSGLKRAVKTLAAFFAVTLGLPISALAVELSHSYFGTLQYTQSTDEFAYSRFIDNEGTFKHNSLLGYQLDARITNDFAATVQIIGTNRLDSDSGQEVRFRQGFLGYAKGDWTFRAGRQRLPLYLDSRNFDVSQTYTVANLPPEVYLTSAADSYDGFSVTKNVSDWLPAVHGEGYAQISLYGGNIDYRFRSAGFGRTTEFFPVMADIAGTALSANGDTWAANVSFIRLDGRLTGSSQFGPLGALPFESDISLDLIAAGLRKQLTERFTLTGEFVQMDSGSLARTSLPLGGVFTESISNNSESIALIGEYKLRDNIVGYLGHYFKKGTNVSQKSIAVGARFDLDLNRSVKAELLGVRANDPTDDYEGPGPRAFNIFSLSYNWAY